MNRSTQLSVVMTAMFAAACSLPFVNAQPPTTTKGTDRGAESVLGGGSRDLLPGVSLGRNAKGSAQTFIIYYANETDPISVGRLAEWLSSSDGEGHHEAAERLHEDAEKFPRVVADEIASLMKGAAADSKLGLIVFTNSLANRGVFQFMDSDDKEPSVVDWPVVKSQLKVFRSHPLAHPRSIRLALEATAKKLGKSRLASSDFVLISKSHGSTKLAIAQGYAPMHEANTKIELLRIVADVKAAAGKSESSGKLVKSKHQIQFDQKLQLETKSNAKWTDELGKKMADNPLASANERNLIGGPTDKGDNTLGLNETSNLNAFDGLGAEDVGQAGQSTLGAAGDTENSTLGAAGDTANSTLSAAEGSENATLDVSNETTLSASRASANTTLDVSNETTLSASRGSGNSTLGAAGDTANSTLGAAGDTANSTLGITHEGNLNVSDGLGIEQKNAAKFLCSGTTKQQLLLAVLNAGKHGMYFNTVFLEACQSELPQPSLEQIRKRKDVNIGRLYFSSATGLRYRTINYPSLFADGEKACCGGVDIRFATRLSNGLDQAAQKHLREGMPYENAGQGFAVIAHRGASGYLPEHTLEAYAMAVGMGADYIEQDVVLTKDDHAIVLHDVHLDTVTDVAAKFPQRKRQDGRWYAIDFTLAEIKTLSVHERSNHETGEPVFDARFPKSKSSFQIPTLTEAIELVQGLNRSTGRDIGIYPEIKKPKWHRDQNKDISQVVIDLLNDHGYRDKTHDVYLQCFDPIELRRIREEMNCGLKLVQLIGSNDWNEASVDYSTLVTDEGIQKIAQYADGIGPWMPYIIKGRTDEGRLDLTELVSVAHQNDLIVHPFTFRADSLPEYAADFPELIRIFRNAGVDGLFTDQCDQTRQAMHAPSNTAPNALLFSSRCDPKSDPTCE